MNQFILKLSLWLLCVVSLIFCFEALPATQKQPLHMCVWSSLSPEEKTALDVLVTQWIEQYKNEQAIEVLESYFLWSLLPLCDDERKIEFMWQEHEALLAKLLTSEERCACLFFKNNQQDTSRIDFMNTVEDLRSFFQDFVLPPPAPQVRAVTPPKPQDIVSPELSYVSEIPELGSNFRDFFYYRECLIAQDLLSEQYPKLPEQCTPPAYEILSTLKARACDDELRQRYVEEKMSMKKKPIKKHSDVWLYIRYRARLNESPINFLIQAAYNGCLLALNALSLRFRPKLEDILLTKYTSQSFKLDAQEFIPPVRTEAPKIPIAEAKKIVFKKTCAQAPAPQASPPTKSDVLCPDKTQDVTVTIPAPAPQVHAVTPPVVELQSGTQSDHDVQSAWASVVQEQLVEEQKEQQDKEHDEKKACEERKSKEPKKQPVVSVQALIGQIKNSKCSFKTVVRCLADLEKKLEDSTTNGADSGAVHCFLGLYFMNKHTYKQGVVEADLNKAARYLDAYAKKEQKKSDSEALIALGKLYAGFFPHCDALGCDDQRACQLFSKALSGGYALKGNECKVYLRLCYRTGNLQAAIHFLGSQKKNQLMYWFTALAALRDFDRDHTNFERILINLEQAFPLVVSPVKQLALKDLEGLADIMQILGQHLDNQRVQALLLRFGLLLGFDTLHINKESLVRDLDKGPAVSNQAAQCILGYLYCQEKEAAVKKSVVQALFYLLNALQNKQSEDYIRAEVLVLLENILEPFLVEFEQLFNECIDLNPSCDDGELSVRIKACYLLAPLFIPIDMFKAARYFALAEQMACIFCLNSPDHSIAQLPETTVAIKAFKTVLEKKDDLDALLALNIGIFSRFLSGLCGLEDFKSLEVVALNERFFKIADAYVEKCTDRHPRMLLLAEGYNLAAVACLNAQKNKELIINYFRKAVGLNRASKRFLCNLGFVLIVREPYLKKDFDEGYDKLTKLADAGCASALFKLSHIVAPKISFGSKHVEKIKNKQKALRFLFQAAEKGEQQAQNEVLYVLAEKDVLTPQEMHLFGRYLASVRLEDFDRLYIQGFRALNDIVVAKNRGDSNAMARYTQEALDCLERMLSLEVRGEQNCSRKAWGIIQASVLYESLELHSKALTLLREYHAFVHGIFGSEAEYDLFLTVLGRINDYSKETDPSLIPEVKQVFALLQTSETQ